MNITLFTARPCPSNNGRWIVCRAVPGMAGAGTVVEDCLTQEAAERECAWLQAEHERAAGGQKAAA